MNNLSPLSPPLARLALFALAQLALLPVPLTTVLHAEVTTAPDAIAAQQLPPITPGRFQPTDESLKQYQYPDWFRDAKLGFWSHWGPQAVPRRGDWYAKRMYVGGGLRG